MTRILSYYSITQPMYCHTIIALTCYDHNGIGFSSNIRCVNIGGIFNEIFHYVMGKKKEIGNCDVKEEFQTPELLVKVLW